MKTYPIIILTTAVASALVALPVNGQSQDMGQNNSQQVYQPKTVAGAIPTDYPYPMRAKDIIGMDVRDSQDNVVGKVQDMVIDLKDGTIAEVVVGSGEFMRAGDKLQAVPPACFTYNKIDKSLWLDNNCSDDLKSAPTFSMSEWKGVAANNAKIADVYQHFNATPRTYQDNELDRASLVLGSAVRNDQDQKLGRVENLIVDISQGRIDKVVLSSGGFLGIDRDLTAFAPQSFAFNADNNQLTLNMTSEVVKDSPHFKESDWRTIATTSTTTSPTAAVTPMTDQSDTSITQAIKAKLQAENSLSAQARGVTVRTQDGKVTLRGTVDTQYERQRLGEIAASVVPAEQVDNQTLVSTSPVAGNGNGQH